MYNHLIGEISLGGYDITVRKSDINSMYQLSTFATSMGDEYRESMLSDTNPMVDKSVAQKFIKQIEHNK